MRAHPVTRTQSFGADSSGQRWLTAYQAPALALVALLCLLTAASLRQPDGVGVIYNSSLDLALAVAGASVGLASGYFVLSEFLFQGTLRSLYLALAMLTFVVAELGLCAIPLMAGRIPGQYALGYAWGVMQLAEAVLLTLSAVRSQSTVASSRRIRMVLNGVVLVISVGVAVNLWAYYGGFKAPDHGGERVLQAVGAAVLFTAAYGYFRRSLHIGSPYLFWLAFASSVAGFAQIQYTLLGFSDGRVQPGDALAIVFAATVLGTSAVRWLLNYRRLRLEARELEALQALVNIPMVQEVSSVVQHIVKVVGDSLHASTRVLVAEHNQAIMRDPLRQQMLQLEADQASTRQMDERKLVVGIDDAPDGEIAVGVPLTTANRDLGMLVIMREVGNPFTPAEMRLLKALGLQASVLLERSLLYEEVAAGAIVEERSRLAREIHDGLAQHLAFLKMRVAWLQRSEVPIERKQLKDVETVLETALIEARHAISTLRADVQTTSATEAIDAYAQEFGQVAGLQVEIRSDPDLPEVGPKARVELLRIVQESLNNVRKHAHAAAVSVSMRARDGGIEVEIQDNGVGFDAGVSLEGHFGLQIMSERASSVGGSFSVFSQPNDGTRVRIWVPQYETDVSDPAAAWLPAGRGHGSRSV